MIAFSVVKAAELGIRALSATRGECPDFGHLAFADLLHYLSFGHIRIIVCRLAFGLVVEFVVGPIVGVAVMQGRCCGRKVTGPLILRSGKWKAMATMRQRGLLYWSRWTFSEGRPCQGGKTATLAYVRSGTRCSDQRCRGSSASLSRSTSTHHTSGPHHGPKPELDVARSQDGRARPNIMVARQSRTRRGFGLRGPR